MKNCFDDVITLFSSWRVRKIRVQLDLSRNVKKQVKRKNSVQAFYMHSPGSIKSTERSGGRLGSARPENGFSSI